MYLASQDVTVTTLILQFAIRLSHMLLCSPEPFLLGCSCGYNELVNYSELWYVHIYLVTICTNINCGLIRDKGHETSIVGTTPKLGECRTLWGKREQAVHYSIDCYVAKALLPVKYHITAHRPFMHGM